MNRNLTPALAARLEAFESRFALRVAGRLSESAEALPADITERLRFAREQALGRALGTRSAAQVVGGGGVAALGGGGWWLRIASVLPLVALVAGLVLISEWHASEQVAAAAEIDAALLADELPPRAYGDAGFVEFLKNQYD